MKPYKIIFIILLITCINGFIRSQGKKLENPVFVFNNAFIKNGMSDMPMKTRPLY